MSNTTLTDGSPVPKDGGHRELKASGQQQGYVVLSAEERAKGFVEPVRHSYRHVGPPPPATLRDLTADEHERYDQYGYVKFEPNPEYERGESPITGTFWTQDRLDRLGGCGVVTTMGDALAETYARDPDFYGATFCCGCGKHLPVGEKGEFVWDGTDQRVGTRSA